MTLIIIIIKFSFKREKEGPVDISEPDREKWIKRMKRLCKLQELVTLHLEKAHVKQTRYYNKLRRDFLYNRGCI